MFKIRAEGTLYLQEDALSFLGKRIRDGNGDQTKLHQTKASTSKILVDDLCVFLEYKQIDTSTIREIESIIILKIL